MRGGNLIPVPLEKLGRNIGIAVQIVMTVDPEIPVPPTHYGGIERIVDMLVRGLAQRGHDIHLFAHPESQVPAVLIPYRGLRSGSAHDTLVNTVQIWRHVARLDRVDVIHSFGRLAYLLPLLRSIIPKIQTYQRHVSARSVRLGRALAGGSLTLAACSRYCAGTAGRTAQDWTIVPNGVSADTYHFESSVGTEAPLVFLGRVERVKGAHTAIQVARRSGRRLVIAGNRSTAKEQGAYFDREIAPLCDGNDITYIGPVTDLQKNILLGRAAALLFPIEWGEPFGIVMVEALACGTPVIALNHGAVREVIEDGVTGFVCDSLPEMVEAVRRIPTLQRLRCRRSYELRFSDRVIVNQYEDLYRAVVRTTRDAHSKPTRASG